MLARVTRTRISPGPTAGSVTVSIRNGWPGSSNRAMRPVQAAVCTRCFPSVGGGFEAEPLAQVALEQFAAGVLRQGVHEEDLFGGLEPGEVVAAVPQDV